MEGTHIRIWIDGAQIVDVHDDKMSESVGGTTLDHGGVGFHWTHDCMGWISDFSILHRGTQSGGLSESAAELHARP